MRTSTHEHLSEDRPKVLYVDDQMGNLTVFRASMRRYAEIRTATSATEALQILDTEEFPIVISDQRMTGMSGSELLTRVRALHPDTVRILLTAHADFGSMIAALNEGRISRFIRKPWKRTEMQAVIAECAADHRALRERKALAAQFDDRAPMIALSMAAGGFAEELNGHVQMLDRIDGLMRTWGIQRGQSPELDTLVEGIDGTRRLAGALARHVARVSNAA